jgi:D-beta-D-heptose 7-phosphate kinase/D-beta-D-heptose 1-phosphate adenosyltransferase
MIDYYGISGDWSPLPNALNYIWTNGCYDVLHVGHLKLLAECKKQTEKNLGSMLMIGIDSDERVKQLKGDSRPINTQLHRAEMLLSLKSVDGVFIYDTAEDLEEILSSLKPKVMVIGDEYKDKLVIGKEHCSEIIFYPKFENFSSTKIISSLQKG